MTESVGDNGYTSRVADADRWHDRASLGLMAKLPRPVEDIPMFYDLRPCSEEQLAMLKIGQQQRGPLSYREMLALANYFEPYQWPEPEVPQGWADWYAHGDES